jgi:hypothetical protein
LPAANIHFDRKEDGLPTILNTVARTLGLKMEFEQKETKATKGEIMMSRIPSLPSFSFVPCSSGGLMPTERRWYNLADH